MGENRRFYWIKLKSTFMSSDAVDFLMGQKNGSQYVVLYQMLCLMTIHSNGRLERQLGEVIIPYDAEKIQRDTKYFSLDTVRVALELFKKLGLIYQNEEDGCLSIAGYEELVGSETQSTVRSRNSREKAKALQCNADCNAPASLLQQNCNTDIEIEKEIDKDLEKENTKEKDSPAEAVESVSAKETRRSTEASDTRGHKDGSTIDIEQAFETFWSEYPRHDSRKAALTAFRHACTSSKVLAEIMNGLRFQNRTKFSRTEKRFVPYASTWLHQERWKDPVDDSGARAAPNPGNPQGEELQKTKIVDQLTGELIEVTTVGPMK
ncbi:MAG: phage replisome organizer N-terminal domain-containing protein [Stecheria intestinalis]|nr:phage replisome organizer N-terminal domain-containing protein [Stecheria intestinalis]MDY4681799.1 phage replisome organizer N-terminal domain-containing protein [Lachnospiraceae bacterium]